MQFPNFSSLQAKIMLLSLILASALGFFETTAINIAIPAIQLKYGATVHNIQWVINAYQLMLAVFMLISGSLGDIYGRKRVLLFGLGVFPCSFLNISRAIPLLLSKVEQKQSRVIRLACAPRALQS
jgi:MFS family permease